MNTLGKLYRRLTCFHEDPRLWKHVRNYFNTKEWKTQEEWECQCCGKIEYFDHLDLGGERWVNDRYNIPFLVKLENDKYESRKMTLKERLCWYLFKETPISF